MIRAIGLLSLSVSSNAAQLKPTLKYLKLRGGTNIGPLNSDKVVSLACHKLHKHTHAANNAASAPRPPLTQLALVNAGAFTLFGCEFLASKWASTRYWDDSEPTVAWTQCAEVFGVGLLLHAAQSYNVAKKHPDAVSDHNKLNTVAWVAWSLVHAKWLKDKTLVTSGRFKGQIGGWIPCGILALLGIRVNFM